MFAPILDFFFPRLRTIQKQHKQARVELVQGVMRLGRKAEDVRQELSRLTLEPIAKG